jgi:peroxiredoxin
LIAPAKPPSLRWIILPVGVGIGLVVGLVLLPAGFIDITAQDGILQVAPIVGSLAPDFELSDTLGNTIRLSDHQGQVVLLNFWATWCVPCRVEMPALQVRFEAHESVGLAILAIDFDESAEQVGDFGREFDLTFPLVLDPGGVVQQLYRVRGYPTSVFLDEQGVIRALHIGVMTESQLDGYLREAGLET